MKGTRDFKGPFENMEFPPYKYSEFPKAVRTETSPDNPRKFTEVIVHNESEEQELTGVAPEPGETETVTRRRRG